ncbi:Vomp family autotransporter [Bartonella sp. B1099]|uniref:Vomp family autotransporter n=1 Tax=Bartonella sp. B1099 TaxID=2911422 RepID=UPI0020C269C4|nr:Vomp family autotransporter [Bartonella sp. B1099]
MKELSIISKRNDWDYRHFSRHLFKKLLLGTIIVAFLSNTSSVYAKNFDRTEQLLKVLEKATAVYSQGNNRNVFSDYNRYNPHTGFFDDTSLSKSSYLTVLTTAIMSRVSTSSSYVDFLITMLSEKRKAAVNVLDKDSSSTQKNLESSVDDNHGNGIALLNTPSSSEEGYPIQVGGRTFVSARGGSNATNLGQGSNAAGVESVAIGYKAQATEKFAITMGKQAEATKEDSIAIGRMAHALGKSSTALGSEYNEKNQDDYTTAKGDYSTALGAVSRALEYGTTAVGHRAYATGKNAISIGFYSRANAEGSIVLGADAKAEKKDSVAFGYKAVASDELSNAFGAYTKATAMGSVALGDSSVADTASQVFGFDPLLKKATTDANAAWKSGRGAVSVGTSDKTRQITKVAAGSADTDAVNIAQLKSLQTYVDKGWKLSVDSKNTKVVGINETVDFATGSENLDITKGKDDNKVTFYLAKNITLESVKVGANTFDATGLKVIDGPQITTAGINAGSKRITNVVDGTDDTDAVNVAQLKALSLGSGSKDPFSDWSKDRVRIGVSENYSTRGSVVIGKKYMSQGTYGEVFDAATVKADLGIAIGTRSLVEKKADRGIAIGERAKVEISGGIALGRNSTANVKEGVFGYDPKTGTNSTSTSVEWKSKDGAFSIGKVGNGGGSWTRQIVGVAAGTQETDAVNVAQLKSLRELITKQGSWELSVGNGKNTVIGAGDKLNLATGSTNFSITSNEEGKKVTFDLAKDLRLNSIKLGGEALENAANSVTLDATGLIITNGPKIVMNGIDAGNKKITGLAEGAEATDAVNFGQLQNIEKQVEQQVAANSFVKQDSNTKHITIGKDTDGDKIDIANKNGDKRTLTGIKDAALSAESKESVTGSQLFSTNNDVATLKNNFSEIQTRVTGIQTNLSTIAKNTSQYLGGGADVQNGKVPTYTVEDKSYNDVASAFSGVNHSFTEVKQQITNVNNSITNVENQIKNVVSESLVQQDKETQHITIGRDTGGDKIDIANSKSENRILTGIKDGALSAESKEAVTGSQLFETNNKVSTYLGGGAGYKNGKWSDPTFKVQTVDAHGNKKDEAYADVAAAFAGVGTSITNVQNKITNDITSKFSELTQNITNITQQVTGDALSWNDEAQAFVARHKKKAEEQSKATGAQENSKITFLLDGAVSKDSTDAITGKQLYSTSNTLATYLDKGAGYDEKGNWKAPGFKVKTVNGDGKEEDKTYSNVAEALTGVGTSFTNVQNKMTKEITNQINNAITTVQGESLVKKDKATNNINIGQEVEGSVINIVNKNGEARILSGVKEAMEVDEAINKGQFDKAVKGLTEDLKFESSFAVHYDKKSNDNGNEVDYTNITLGKNNTPTALHNVANGIISDKSHDAITGGQIYKIGGDIAKFLGGDAAFNNGVFTGPTYALSEVSKEGQVTDKPFSDVGTAFAGLDSNIKNVNDRIKEVSQEIAQDSLLWSKQDGAFVASHGAGDTRKDSKITHISAGDITAVSTDAVIGKQLYELHQTLATYLGGGSEYNKDKGWKAPDFKIQQFGENGKSEEKTYHDVAAAFEGVNNSVTNMHDKITNQISQVVRDSLVKQEKATDPITIGKATDGIEINIANKDKEDRTLSGVKTATQDNEAVNKAQLDKLDKKIESTNSFAVFYDKQSDGTVNYKSVTFGGKNKEPVALHNVADGELTQESHDAMNGGQITKIFQQVVKYFGGSAAFKEGIFTGPIYKLLSISENGEVGQKAHDNIVSAFEGLDTNIKNVNKRIKEVSQGISDDSLLWDKDEKAFVALHGEGKTRTNSKITYLKDGDVTASSSDAVNGSQLYSLNEQLASYFGGGAGYNNQGNWQAPNFKIKQFGEDGDSEEKSYSNIADALSGVGNSFTNIQHRITHEISKIESENLVKQDEKTKRITIGGEKDGSEISIANSANGVRSLSGVKAGLLTEKSTEAINGSQLYSVINVLSRYFSGDAGYKDGKWLAPNFKVAQFTAAGVVSKREEYTNVASAIEAVNESMTNISNRIHDVEQSIFSGGLNWSETEKAFDARHKGQDSKIKHVADGEISEGSKEAVNGRQLWQTNKKVKEVESHVNMIDKQVKDIASVADIAVKYDKGNDGKKTNKVTLIGMSESDPVLIDNVAEGRIESGSKEAVTGGQLHDYTNKKMNLVLSDAKKYTDERFKDIVNNTVHNVIHETKSYTDVKFEVLRYEIKEVRKESRRAAAIGLAVSNLSYEDTPGSLSLSIGTGIWRDQSAFAVGAGYMSENGRVRSNISATSSGRHWGIGAGLRVKLN